MAPEATPPSAGVDILIVEDSAIQATLLRRTLVQHGFAVTVARDGAEGLALIRQRKPTLVISDIEMPQMNGYELCHEIKRDETLQDIPVILLTALTDPEDIIRGLNAGADNYLTKPYDEQYLLRRIDYVLTNKKLREISRVRVGIEIHFAGKSHIVDSDRQQILDLLLSTFENAVQQNRELLRTQLELKMLNEQLELRNKFIRTTFGRYLTDEVVASLLDSPEGTTLGGERRQVTILMSDLRGFTSLAGRLAPEQVVTILNRYLETMVEVIVQYQGTIDEFIGDAILVIFGAPIWRQDDAQRAVACAVAMQLAMTTVNNENSRIGLPTVEMGIGVHTGAVVVGNIGSYKRAKYGAVGLPVNLTSRIQSYTIGGQTLISEATRQAAGPLVSVAKQMDVEAKGIAHPITLYELQGIGGAYNLFLPERAETLLPLRQDLPLQYTVLEGDYVGRTVYTGSLVTLSAQGGEVHTTHPVAPWSDVKIQLMGGNGEKLSGELYGKVLRALPASRPGFYVHFTSIPSEVATFFQRLLASSTPGNTT